MVGVGGRVRFRVVVRVRVMGRVRAMVSIMVGYYGGVRVSVRAKGYVILKGGVNSDVRTLASSRSPEGGTLDRVQRWAKCCGQGSRPGLKLGLELESVVWLGLELGLGLGSWLESGVGVGLGLTLE